MSTDDVSYERAVELLYFWNTAGGTNFSSLLYDLIAKSDQENKMRLQKAFPNRCQAFDDWWSSSDPVQFFIKNGFGGDGGF